MACMISTLFLAFIGAVLFLAARHRHGRALFKPLESPERDVAAWGDQGVKEPAGHGSR